MLCAVLLSPWGEAEGGQEVEDRGTLALLRGTLQGRERQTGHTAHSCEGLQSQQPRHLECKQAALQLLWVCIAPTLGVH